MMALAISGAIATALFAASTGLFAGLWWGERNTSRVWERAYNHVRDQLPAPPSTLPANTPQSTAIQRFQGG